MTSPVRDGGTNRSITAGDCVVVGIQCRPRPLSPFGCGYASSDHALSGIRLAAVSADVGCVGYVAGEVDGR